MDQPARSARAAPAAAAAISPSFGAPMLSLQRLDAKTGEPAMVDLDLADLSDARLVLTDDLIRASLRAAKATLKGAPVTPDATAPEKAPARSITKAARQTVGQFFLYRVID